MYLNQKPGEQYIENPNFHESAIRGELFLVTLKTPLYVDYYIIRVIRFSHFEVMSYKNGGCRTAGQDLQGDLDIGGAFSDLPVTQAA